MRAVFRSGPMRPTASGYVEIHVSLDFIVFCQDRPRLAPGHHRIGPIAVVGPRARSTHDDWAARRLPAPASVGAWVLQLNCRPAVGETAELLGRLIAENSGGGGVVCDHHSRGTVIAARASISGDDLVAELTRRVKADYELEHGPWPDDDPDAEDEL